MYKQTTTTANCELRTAVLRAKNDKKVVIYSNVFESVCLIGLVSTYITKYSEIFKSCYRIGSNAIEYNQIQWNVMECQT